MNRRRALRITGWVVLSLVLVVVVAFAAIVVFIQTDAGRERIRRFAVSTLNEIAEGEVRIGRITGDVIDGITLHDVSITDNVGAPLFAADRLVAAYDVLDFLRGQILLTDVEVVRPLLVLESDADGVWNYQRVFPGDDTPTTDDAPSRWQRIEFRDVELSDGHIVVRTPWTPDDDLTAAQQDSLTQVALGGGLRANVIRAAGEGNGLQSVWEFRDVNGVLPRLLLAHPDQDHGHAEIATLGMTAALFNPPEAEVRNMSATLKFNGDSLWWEGADIVLPASRISGDGRFAFESGDIHLGLRGAPVAFADLRWIYPPLPSEGEGTLDFVMDIVGDTASYIVRNADIHRGETRLAGDFGLTITDSLRFHSTNLTFSALDLALVEQLAGVDIPRDGTIAGRLAMAGTFAALRVDTDVTFDDRLTGRSRAIAVGEVGFGEEVRMRGLRVQFAPVQVALARAVMPDLPVGGVITGTGTVDGSPGSRIIARFDLVHAEDGARSQVVGNANVRLAGARHINVDARLSPLSLVTVGRFAPAMGLHGAVSGPVSLVGPFSALELRSNLAVSGGGRVEANGLFDIASAEPGYALNLALELFDASRVLDRAPATSLTAFASASGRGTDPATMQSNVVADLTTSTYDEFTVDSARVRVAIADGLARVDTLVLGAPGAWANVSGTLGMTAGREGALTYAVAIDSLAAFDRWLPTDTGTVAPRPGRAAREAERVRLDSLRLARATEVERAALGLPPPAAPVADTIGAISRDSLFGSIYTVGTISGSIDRFNLEGRAGAERIVVGGNAAEEIRVEYRWHDAMTDEATIVAGARGTGVEAAGFALDNIEGRLVHRAGSGTALMEIHQNSNQEFAFGAEYILEEEQRTLLFNDLRLRFDTTTWASVRPGTVRFGTAGVQVDSLELRSGESGRIFVDGLLPTDGVANMVLDVDNFQISHLVALLQADVPMRGLVTFTGNVSGTTASPVVVGAMGVLDGSYMGTTLPELHASFDYENVELVLRADANRLGGAPMLVATGTIPVDLGMEAPNGRFPEGRPITFDINADSLPLENVPTFTETVTRLRGVLRGAIAVRGTVADPSVAGAIDVADGSAYLQDLGMTLRSVAASIRMEGDTVVIDSIAGRSDGTIRLSGGIGIRTLAEPSFDLTLTAENARVLDSELGRMNADADIKMLGPFDAPHITGTAAVRNGVIYLPATDNREVISARDPAIFNVIDTSVVSEAEIFEPESAFLRNLRMDVELSVGRDTWIRNREANVEIFSDQPLRIHIDRGRNAMALDGVVNTERGQYTFLSKRFEIRRGSAIFIGGESGLNPTLQITGEHEVQLPASKAVRINVIIGGTLENPQLALDSDAQPPISQSDLLSYLAFGRTSSSLLQLSGPSGGSGGMDIGAVGSLAGQQLAGVALGVAVNQLEGEGARSLGLDYFNITPAETYADIAAGNVLGFLGQTDFEFGRYIDTRTFLAGQLQLGAALRPGLRAEHRTDAGYRIETSWEPRLIVQDPTLGEQGLKSGRAFGLFLVREWRF